MSVDEVCEVKYQAELCDNLFSARRYYRIKDDDISDIVLRKINEDILEETELLTEMALSWSKNYAPNHFDNIKDYYMQFRRNEVGLGLCIQILAYIEALL